MGRPVVIYDLAKLQRLWAAGKTHVEIAAALGCSECHVGKLVQRHKLPPRKRGRPRGEVDDPTEEEIAQRCAVIREKHLELVRQSDPKPAGIRYGNVREVAWDGFRFNAVS